MHGKIGSDWQMGARYLSQLNFKYNNGTAKFTQVTTGLAVPELRGPPLNVPPGTPIDALLTPQFQVGGPLVSQGANTQLNHPWQGELGIAYTGFTNWTLELDYQVTGFSSFKNINLRFTGPAAADSQNLIEDYNNSWTIRAGAEKAFASGDQGPDRRELREHAGAGCDRDTAAARPEPREHHARCRRPDGRHVVARRGL